jgi:hypothetical protein
MTLPGDDAGVNAGYLVLLVIAAWALLSILVAVTVGEAASTRDDSETKAIERVPTPSDEPRRVAS